MVNILTQALSYSTDKNYQLKFYNQSLPKVRVFQNIANKGGIDIIAAGATIDREKMLRPIYFPLIKGLFGWRIPLVSEKNEHLFLPKLSTAAFKKLTAGQLRSWSDTKILESNNLPVEKGSHYQGLFHMLTANRFDYFPRSILEIQRELDEHKNMKIVIDSNILIHYPTALYFYVNKDNEVLAEDVKFGLEQSLKDGSFERIFTHYYGEIINHTINEKRRVYQLNNPFLPTKTPLHRKELWVDLAVN
ncbi:MAG: transporter substrate-binding domain-containing protein [Colwellia sp.]|nr:transporter substrate-binding domain-containing protein [Colwellia sp.]MCW8866671.1 transporter substrate-binding domain-containing protein [Colwellia sp.]MCW9080858.1 transporter substrate-binding domain-containing protein [Colwellia sp.]